LSFDICFVFDGRLAQSVYAGGFSADTYELYYLAKEMYTIPQAILIIAGIGSLLIEDAARKLE
jgi:hypothetical protein